MCEYCHQYRCPPGCPNAPEPDPIGTCKYCGEEIVVGDKYYEFEGEIYHEDCFEEDAVHILVEVGAELKEASEDDLDDGSDYEYERYVDEQLCEKYFGDY